MLLSDLAFQAVVALIWSLIGIPFAIFNSIASSVIGSALGL